MKHCLLQHSKNILFIIAYLYVLLWSVFSYSFWIWCSVVMGNYVKQNNKATVGLPDTKKVGTCKMTKINDWAYGSINS